MLKEILSDSIISTIIGTIGNAFFSLLGRLLLFIRYRKRNYVREVLIRKYYGRYEYAGKAIIGNFFQPILLWALVLGLVGFLLLMGYNIIFR